MSYITSLIPTSSDKPSLLMIYLTSMLILSGLSILATAIVSACYDKVKPSPFCFEILAKRSKKKVSYPGNDVVARVTWKDASRMLDKIFFYVFLLIIVGTKGAFVYLFVYTNSLCSVNSNL